MASSESSNLVAEFEQAYAEALSTLCEEEILSDRAAVEEQKIVSFYPIDGSDFWHNLNFRVPDKLPEKVKNSEDSVLSLEIKGFVKNL
jgi:hypothetical protein